MKHIVLHSWMGWIRITHMIMEAIRCKTLFDISLFISGTFKTRNQENLTFLLNSYMYKTVFMKWLSHDNFIVAKSLKITTIKINQTISGIPSPKIIVWLILNQGKAIIKLDSHINGTDFLLN